MSTKKPDVASARQLRRNYALLSKVAERVLAIGYDVEGLRAELRAAVERKPNRTLEQLMGELRSMHAELLAIVPQLPRWTPEQRAAFEAGENAKTDDRIREGFRTLASRGELP